MMIAYIGPDAGTAAAGSVLVLLLVIGLPVLLALVGIPLVIWFIRRERKPLPQDGPADGPDTDSADASTRP